MKKGRFGYCVPERKLRRHVFSLKGKTREVASRKDGHDFRETLKGAGTEEQIHPSIRVVRAMNPSDDFFLTLFPGALNYQESGVPTGKPKTLNLVVTSGRALINFYKQTDILFSDEVANLPLNQ